MARTDGSQPSVIQVGDRVLQVRDDVGNWGGGSMGITHQRGPGYWAKKVLDLSGVSQDQWQSVKECRLSAYFCVRDYSWHDCPVANGLDEAVEVVVNGHSHRFATAAGLPVYEDGKSMSSLMQWHDFSIPKDELVRGINEIIFRMAPVAGKEPDDYLYLGIDTSVAGGSSFVRFAPDAEWRGDVLTIPGGRGEYMVRMYLLSGSRQIDASWSPAENSRTDPEQLITYAGSHGETVRVEWDPRRIDRLEQIEVRVATEGSDEYSLAWLDEQGRPVAPALVRGPLHQARLSAPLTFLPSGIELSKNQTIESIAVSAWANYHPLPPVPDMAPHMNSPRGRRVEREPVCRVEGNRVLLANDCVRCELVESDGRLELKSLFNELTGSEMVRHPKSVALWMVEVDGVRYSGSEHFVCQTITALPDATGVRVTAVCEKIGLEAEFTVTIDDSLHVALTVTNRSDKPVDFKVAFPHLAGLAVSDVPADDYYFFPRSLLVSDLPALIRQGYGDHQALYQLMDIFSPDRGGGLSIHSADPDGRYKVLALRKYVPARAKINEDDPLTPTDDAFKWTSSLPEIEGIGITYEYLRRTREPGESFAPSPAILRAHAGDWRTPMEHYAHWCRSVWTFRPYPSRLTPVLNMIAEGWGQSPLARDGKYRTDFVRPRCDCIELMSWWEWSSLGPKAIPLDQVEKVLGETKYEMWKSYFVRDGESAPLMFSNNPGDYDGYNQRWGGLPALRDAMAQYRDMGALVTLYTDPLRVDYNTNCGRQYGEKWSVMQSDGTYRDDYDAWRMCHDVAEYRQWVADAMRRVMLETGADGIRLDEYGHAGSACFSCKHEHTYAEWGCTEWQRGVAETTRLVRQAMDEVNPRSVLTTEHPGYDFLLPLIDGCITYDLTVLATPLRPVEVNLQRFLFPECKAFELDHRGADTQHRKRFWNGVASFGAYYPLPYDTILRQNAETFASRDCQPLIPTQASRVYANCFRSELKEIYTLYNATGHTFFGNVLSLEVRADQHVFDLLRCAEADTTRSESSTQARTFLPRDDVACLAVLPRLLALEAQADQLQVRLPEVRGDCRIEMCDATGMVLATETVRAIVTSLPAVSPRARQPVCVKLLQDGLLLDAISCRTSDQPVSPSQ